MFLTLLCSTVSKWDTFSSFFGFSPMGEPVEIYQRGLPSSISFYSGLIIYRQDLALSFNSIAIHWMSLCRYVDIGYWDEQDKDPTHRELIELCYIPLWTFVIDFSLFFHTWNTMIKWNTDDIISIYKFENIIVVNVRFKMFSSMRISLGSSFALANKLSRKVTQ